MDSQQQRFLLDSQQQRFQKPCPHSLNTYWAGLWHICTWISA